jgi:MIP family channel proteins
MDRRSWSALTAEAVGTFLFFFVGAGSVVLIDFMANNKMSGSGGLLGVAIAHGLVLGVLVSCLGAVSGGHFNPAVTFGVWIAGRISTVMGVSYVIAQLIAAVVAGLALRAIFPESAWQPSNIGTPALGPGVTPAIGIAMEAVMTVLLLLTVLGTAIDPRAPKIGGLAIGFAIAADIMVGGPVTGAAMNVARWFGPAVASGHFDNWYVWVIGPLLGAAVAAALYRGVLAEEAVMARTPGSPEAS